MSQNIIEQLKIAIAIEEAKASGNPIEWQTKTGDMWYDVIQDYRPMEYLRHNTEIRLKPEPVMVELGPEDVEPGSAMRCLGDQGDTSWWSVSQVCRQGVYLRGELLDWNTMRDRGMEIHRPSKPGVWEKCEKLSHE